MFKPGEIVRSVNIKDINKPFLEIISEDGVFRGVTQYRCVDIDPNRLRFSIWRSERQLRKLEKDSKVYDE